jgi:hypothetical protein
MAVQAGSIPANVPTAFDLGRSVSLWVSALKFCRIHASNGQACSPCTGYLKACITAIEVSVAGNMPHMFQRGKRRSAGRRGLKPVRYPLPCWIYGKLYQTRNDFLHGNPIPKNALSPKGTKNGLFWLGPSLYRLALSGFLGLSTDPSVRKKLPCRFSDAASANPQFHRLYRAQDFQSMSERALLRIMK